MVANNQKGQSVLELMIMLPAVFGLFILMLKISTTIQISIVNQKYARAILLYNTDSSPYAPRKVGDKSVRERMINASHANAMIVGVSQDAIGTSAENQSPVAPSYKISKKGSSSDEEAHQEPDTRSDIRVRATAVMCTHSHGVDVDGKFVESTPELFKQGGKINLAYCRIGQELLQ